MRLAGLIAGICLFISACSNQPTGLTLSQAELKAIWSTHQSKIANISHWQISGRFGAKDEINTWQGSIYWEQNNDQYNILISGPLGTGSFSLTGNSQLAILKVAKNQSYSARDPELLLETHTGIRLPINHLSYWILGLPAPQDGSTILAFNNRGLLAHLSQTGWDIVFKSYTSVNNTHLPNKIFIESRELDARLVIKKWEIAL